MREFFRGWKTKVGCVTLLTALGFMGLWVRSLQIPDKVAFSLTKNVLIQLISQDGGLTVRTIKSKFQVTTLKGSSFDRLLLLAVHPPTTSGPGHFAVSVDEYTFKVIGNPYKWTLHGSGFGIGNVEDKEGLSMQVSVWQAPYWAIVVPLTALTAYLLLAKSRRSTETKVPETIPVEGPES